MGQEDVGENKQVEDAPKEMDIDAENTVESLKDIPGSPTSDVETIKSHATENDNVEKMDIEEENNAEIKNKDIDETIPEKKLVEQEVKNTESTQQDRSLDSDKDSAKSEQTEDSSCSATEKSELASKDGMDVDKKEAENEEKIEKEETPNEEKAKEKLAENINDNVEDKTQENTQNTPKKAEDDNVEKDNTDLTVTKATPNGTPEKKEEPIKEEEEIKAETTIKEALNDEITAEKKSKPLLKLASFADMSTRPVFSPIKDKKGCILYKATGCAQCFQKVDYTINATVWETMQFCEPKCLAGYQGKMNKCSTCRKVVNVGSLGKYCVRFGSDVKQFCSNVCLEDHKKGLKVCCYCQKNITGMDGFLAPIGGKGQFKDFCAPKCLQKYQELHGTKKIEKEVSKCAVCLVLKPVDVKLILLPSHGKTEFKCSNQSNDKNEEEEEKFKKKECEQDAAMAFDLPLESPEKSKIDKQVVTPAKKERRKQNQLSKRRK